MSFNGYKIYAADIQFRNSLVAATANDGGKTYETQRQALILNPYNDQYHRAYANTNLQLATSISQSENPSDQDRNNITQLIQQAIREGRAAITVQPNNPANWEALANIYRQLIGVAQDAPQWTTATYAQAINIDPNNPRLRLELGGVYFQLQDFATAQRFFEQAVTLKPNYANAHYNLARAYVEQDQIEAAVNQYNAVLSLIDRSSADYQRAMDEQDLLKKQLGRTTTPEDEAAAAPETQLSVPQPIATPTPGEEQIDLGEDVAPPENIQGSLGQDGGDFPVATPEPEAETGTEN